MSVLNEVATVVGWTIQLALEIRRRVILIQANNDDTIALRVQLDATLSVFNRLNCSKVPDSILRKIDREFFLQQCQQHDCLIACVLMFAVMSQFFWQSLSRTARQSWTSGWTSKPERALPTGLWSLLTTTAPS
jgi:hypothetical protein